MEEEEFATSKKKKNNIIIVAIIIIILILAAFLLVGGDFPDLFNSQPAPVLVIGQLSPGELLVLDNLNQEFVYSLRDAKDLESSSIEELKDYSIIIIDQTVTEKSISLDLGSALKSYVEKGGKIIIVKNSAIRTSLGLNGVEAGDSMGWATTLGDIAPAECILINGNEPSCKEGKEVPVVARIIKQEDHPIMYGIDITPTNDLQPYELGVLPIQARDGAKTIAYFDVENTPQTFPAIIEKSKLLGGKVVYFNYDPGMTPTIFKNTLIYLK